MTTHYCPTEDFTCPYFDSKAGFCLLRHPVEECDDYASHNPEELEELEAEENRRWNEWGPFAVYDPD